MVDNLTIGNVKNTIDTVHSVKNLWDKYTEYRDGKKKCFIVSISDQDYIYFDVQAWLATLPADKDITRWSASTAWNETVVKFAYDGDSYHFVNWDGIKLGFKVEQGKGNNDDEESFTKLWAKSLFMRVETAQEAKKLREKIQDISNHKKKLKNPPSIYIFSKWGWDKSDSPLRDLSSVILKEDTKETISGDISRFLSEEKDYLNKGIPWHRGILLHGPPGTGKTSLVKGLAKEHGMNIYYLSLSDMTSDSMLLDRIHEVPPKSIVLMEDIDSSEAAQGNTVTSGVTTSGLLNVLDGLFTPYGMVCIVTTNFPEKLTPALIRPGRIDLNVKLDFCTTEQANRLYFAFYKKKSNFDFGSLEVTSAEITEIFKQNLHDPEKADQDLKDFLILKASNVEYQRSIQN